MPETAPNRLTPQERYLRDVQFKALVDLLCHHIRACDYTPTEVREAAMLAAIRAESFATRQVTIPGLTVKQFERFREGGDGR